MKKLKALIQWFMALEVTEHRHWCTLTRYGNTGRCEHMTGCWFCTGIFCVGLERKDCIECSKLTKEQKELRDKKLSAESRDRYFNNRAEAMLK